jgi:hypothetical protein
MQRHLRVKRLKDGIALVHLVRPQQRFRIREVRVGDLWEPLEHANEPRGDAVRWELLGEQLAPPTFSLLEHGPWSSTLRRRLGPPPYGLERQLGPDDHRILAHAEVRSIDETLAYRDPLYRPTSPKQLWNRDKAKTAIEPAEKDPNCLQRLPSIYLVRPPAINRAVVADYDASRPKSVQHPVNDLDGVASVPVFRVNAPSHHFVAQPPEMKAAFSVLEAIRKPKQAAAVRSKCLRARPDLPSSLLRGELRERQMTPRMVADSVASLSHVLDEPRVLPGKLTDHEERGPRIMLP